jgi:hypothetical protein
VRGDAHEEEAESRVGRKHSHNAITAKERTEIAKRIKNQQKQLRKTYPEVHGKIVDFITHSIDDGTLYFSVRFKDKTSFCLRYGCDMFVVGADLSDWKNGDYNIIREYMRPIPG